MTLIHFIYVETFTTTSSFSGNYIKLMSKHCRARWFYFLALVKETEAKGIRNGNRKCLTTINHGTQWIHCAVLSRV